MPWIDQELESHRLTDNLRMVTAMMKVYDVVLEEDIPMVDIAYIDMAVSYTHLTLPTTPYV